MIHGTDTCRLYKNCSDVLVFQEATKGGTPNHGVDDKQGSTISLHTRCEVRRSTTRCEVRKSTTRCEIRQSTTRCDVR